MVSGLELWVYGSGFVTMTAPELSFPYSLGTSREQALHSVRRDAHSMIPESPLLL